MEALIVSWQVRVSWQFLQFHGSFNGFMADFIGSWQLLQFYSSFNTFMAAFTGSWQLLKFHNSFNSFNAALIVYRQL